MHPVYVALSLAGALACSAVCRGGRATLLSLRWVVPLCLIVAAANPLFVASGSTELFRIGSRAVYAEAVAYGLCSGGMFAAVFLWFASYSACLDSQRTMMLFGRLLPTVTLMVSQVLRLVPQFVSRGRAVLAVQNAASAATAQTKREKAAARLRVVNVLMGWGMEDSLERSDAMRARGYNCGAKRTSYRRFRIGRADVCVLVCLLVLVAASVACALVELSGYAFYPTMKPIGPWWRFAPYALFMLFPVALSTLDWWRWRSCR
ncbi:energy-coupling factor transporter transmembrane component T [uncultured Senegalimassilia sp.]|uniref:energy-coupling factor transporter transmembrane component T n=1 Tax=uncultured Senegalimassilia sp. TaxID=1714350 RepID=UPI0025FC51F1|nr:energy-coupling factor transporter transmembrane component T [uncultured Senegalimassilia sp.]